MTGVELLCYCCTYICALLINHLHGGRVKASTVSFREGGGVSDGDC